MNSKLRMLLLGGGAVVIGLVGVVLMTQGNPPPAPMPVATAPTPAAPELKALVAATNLDVGKILSPDDLEWKVWKGATSGVITDAASPRALEEWVGSAVRAAVKKGEALAPQKLVRADAPGFLATVLPVGMRAVAVPIAIDSAGGGIISPSDRVDVIWAKRDVETSRQSGQEAWTSQTILRNVLVLAIDKNGSAPGGGTQAVAPVRSGGPSGTATLALNPRQTEAVTMAKAGGTLSLSLRSLAEAKKGGNAEDDDVMTVITFGSGKNIPTGPGGQ